MPAAQEKAGSRLRAILGSSQHVRVILRLRSTGTVVLEQQKPKRSDFPSAAHYRKALAGYRRTQIQAEIGPTVKLLKKRQLTLHCSELGHSVVVEGPARVIKECLAYEGVESATLDEEIPLLRDIG